MQDVCDRKATPTHQKSLQECAKLIRKLRWIGMESEARRLEFALKTLPGEERIVSIEPASTD
jgi:hypothetical protein